MVCASKSGKVIGTVVAINPSNDADRNAKVSLFCLIAVDKRSFFNDQYWFKYISAQKLSFIRK